MIKYLKRTLLVLVALVMSGLAMTSCGDDEDGQDTYKIVPVVVDKGTLTTSQYNSLQEGCVANTKVQALSSLQNVMTKYNTWKVQLEEQVFRPAMQRYYEKTGAVCTMDIQLQNSNNEVIQHHVFSTNTSANNSTGAGGNEAK